MHTKLHAERKVALALQRNDIEAFLPEMWSEHKGRSVALFPCYLFTRIDLEEEGVARLRWEPGVRHIVSYGDRPVPVPDEAIDLIRRNLENKGAVEHAARVYFKKGEIVRIRRGPFAELLAIFDGPSTPTRRVEVLIEFLGRLSQVRVDVDNLEAVTEEVQAPSVKRPRRTRGRGRRIRACNS